MPGSCGGLHSHEIFVVLADQAGVVEDDEAVWRHGGYHDLELGYHVIMEMVAVEERQPDWLTGRNNLAQDFM